MNDMLRTQIEIENRWKAGGNIIVTSDIHAFHKNLCKGSSSWADKSGCRDFPNQFLMTEAVAANINAVAKEDDLVIHLGDFAFGGLANIPIMREKIVCKNIVNLYGNHDEHLREKSAYQDLFFSCLDYLEFRINGVLFCCQHYPIEEWHDINDGSVHLFGHRHTIGRIPLHGRSMDVGLDSNGIQPYKLDELFNFMTTIEPYRKHHHR